MFQIPHLPYYVLLSMSSLVCYIESVLTMISPPVSVGDVSQHPFILIIIFFLNCAIYSTLRNYVYWYVCIYCRYNHKCFHIKIMHFIYIKKIQSYLSLNKTFTDYLPLMMKNKKFIYFELFQALNCFGEWHNLNVSTNYLWYFVIIKIFVKLFPKLQNFIELVFFLTFS